LKTEELFDFFIGGGEVYDLVAFVTNCVVMRVRLVFKKCFTAESDFFDVTFSNKLIKVTIYGSEIDMG
jgi:hypothetical protein